MAARHSPTLSSSSVSMSRFNEPLPVPRIADCSRRPARVDPSRVRRRSWRWQAGPRRRFANGNPESSLSFSLNYTGIDDAGPHDRQRRHEACLTPRDTNCRRRCGQQDADARSAGSEWRTTRPSGEPTPSWRLKTHRPTPLNTGRAPSGAAIGDLLQLAFAAIFADGEMVAPCMRTAAPSHRERRSKGSEKRVVIEIAVADGEPPLSNRDAEDAERHASENCPSTEAG